MTTSEVAGVSTAEQLQYVAAMNDYLRSRNMTPLPVGTTYVEAKNRYDELTGGAVPHTLADRVTVTAKGAYDPATDANWPSLYRTMQAGGGAGVLQPKIHNAYLQRTGQMPFYRPAQSQAWMGTGSRAAWHAEMARQSNEYLGVVAAPIGLLGGAAKSVYDVAAFSLKAGKTLLGTSAYLHTLGAIGGEDFAATSNLLKGAGDFAWNSAGNYVYTLSGGALAQQEHAAYMEYVGAVAGAAYNLWDGTYGAWSRGDYLSAGETVGGVVGIPLPLAKVGYFGKFRALDNVVANSEVLGGAGGKWRVIDEVADGSVVQQATPTSCGQACAQMLLTDRGVIVDQVKLGGELTSAQSLAAKMNKLDSGWVGAGVDSSSFGALNETGSWSAMMWERGNGYGHWVVVDGLNDSGRVLLRDPFNATRYSMNPLDFDNAWSGYSVFKPKP